MGKGGVGKTTLATEIALKLTKLGAKVHLTTTDPGKPPELQPCSSGRYYSKPH